MTLTHIRSRFRSYNQQNNERISTVSLRGFKLYFNWLTHNMLQYFKLWSKIVAILLLTSERTEGEGTRLNFEYFWL